MRERIAKYMSRWFVLGNFFRPIIPFTVNLLYWKPAKGDNVGDLLSLIIYKQMLKMGGGKTFILYQNKKSCSYWKCIKFRWKWENHSVGHRTHE